MYEIKLQRIYSGERVDGKRILVDRVWPRGISKVNAAIDLWLKEIGPTTELRKWFGHVPERFADFRTRYIVELRENATQKAALETLFSEVKEQDVTLLFGARDEQYNQAVILKELLLERQSE